MRTLRILRAYITHYLLAWLASRSFAFTLVANQAVTPLMAWRSGRRRCRAQTFPVTTWRCWSRALSLFRTSNTPSRGVSTMLSQASFTLSNALLAVPALVGAAALQFMFTYTLALSAFWTERAHGVVGIGGTLVFLLGGEAVPAPLLPDALRPLGVALPFRAMHGFPAEIAAGMLAPDASQHCAALARFGEHPATPSHTTAFR
jgi:hypothetical protein